MVYDELTRGIFLIAFNGASVETSILVRNVSTSVAEDFNNDFFGEG
jgi:hypothetical protein